MAETAPSVATPATAAESTRTQGSGNDAQTTAATPVSVPLKKQTGPPTTTTAPAAGSVAEHTATAAPAAAPTGNGNPVNDAHVRSVEQGKEYNEEVSAQRKSSGMGTLDLLTGAAQYMQVREYEEEKQRQTSSRSQSSHGTATAPNSRPQSQPGSYGANHDSGSRTAVAYSSRGPLLDQAPKAQNERKAAEQIAQRTKEAEESERVAKGRMQRSHDLNSLRQKERHLNEQGEPVGRRIHNAENGQQDSKATVPKAEHDSGHPQMAKDASVLKAPEDVLKDIEREHEAYRRASSAHSNPAPPTAQSYYGQHHHYTAPDRRDSYASSHGGYHDPRASTGSYSGTAGTATYDQGGHYAYNSQYYNTSSYYRQPSDPSNSGYTPVATQQQARRRPSVHHMYPSELPNPPSSTQNDQWAEDEKQRLRNHWDNYYRRYYADYYQDFYKRYMTNVKDKDAPGWDRQPVDLETSNRASQTEWHLVDMKRGVMLESSETERRSSGIVGEADSADTKSKRKGGRPRKDGTGSRTSISDSLGDGQSHSGQDQPGKRGRRSKAERRGSTPSSEPRVSASMGDDDSGNGEDKLSKRGRGRPRKEEGPAVPGEVTWQFGKSNMWSDMTSKVTAQEEARDGDRNRRNTIPEPPSGSYRVSAPAMKGGQEGAEAENTDPATAAAAAAAAAAAPAGEPPKAAKQSGAADGQSLSKKGKTSFVFVSNEPSKNRSKESSKMHKFTFFGPTMNRPVGGGTDFKGEDLDRVGRPKMRRAWQDGPLTQEEAAQQKKGSDEYEYDSVMDIVVKPSENPDQPTGIPRQKPIPASQKPALPDGRDKQPYVSKPTKAQMLTKEEQDKKTATSATTGQATVVPAVMDTRGSIQASTKDLLDYAQSTREMVTSVMKSTKPRHKPAIRKSSDGFLSPESSEDEDEDMEDERDSDDEDVAGASHGIAYNPMPLGKTFQMSEDLKKALTPRPAAALMSASATKVEGAETDSAEDGSAGPVKRGRGRPPKAATLKARAAAASVADATSTATPMAVDPLRRSAGRGSTGRAQTPTAGAVPEPRTIPQAGSASAPATVAKKGGDVKLEATATPTAGGKPPLPDRFCDFCLGKDNENPRKTVKEKQILLHCSECPRAGHPECLQLPSEIIPVLHSYDWECIDCKGCLHCGLKDQEEKILFCDKCDRGAHLFCLDPPLEQAPDGDWFCQICEGVPKSRVRKVDRSAEAAMAESRHKEELAKASREAEKNLKKRFGTTAGAETAGNTPGSHQKRKAKIKTPGSRKKAKK
eukprot:Clim_evm32s241 gene=Clim_evmTU32s241